MNTKRAINYINNKTMFEEMVKYKESLRLAEENNLAKPQIPKYIGECIMKICNKLATKGNFSGYTYKSEFIGDGLVDCIAAVDNFKPEKSSNPFAYFTQIAWNAFLRRIEKEKKQNYIKHKNLSTMYMENNEELYVDNEVFKNDNSIKVINDFESRLTLSQKKPMLKGVEKFTKEEKENAE